MKINMAKTAKRVVNLTGKNFILCLIAWFILCTVFYVFISIWEGNRSQKLIHTGVSISKGISSQAGLPLLEKDKKRLTQFIEKIAQKPDVVFASIIDHKNKIIAYTDQEQFFTLNRHKSGVLDDVHYWKISNSNHKRVMNFSSEVTFSDTRIGEVYISLAADNIGQLTRPFVFFAVLTLLVIVFLFGIANYKKLSWLNTSYAKVRSPEKSFIEDSIGSEISCPLCGKRENFSLNGFSTPDLEKFSILKQYPGTNSSVLLEDMEKVEELGWLKRLIVVQCTEIINKVVAE
jgi:hypothetical protein